MSILSDALLIEKEMACLGGLIQKPKLLDKVLLSPDDFVKVEHQNIYRAMLEIKASGQMPDITALVRYLNGQIEPTYYTNLMDAAPVPTLAVDHADTIKLNSIRSQIITILDTTHNLSQLTDRLTEFHTSSQILTEYSQKTHRSLTGQVEKYLDDHEGVFSTTELYTAFQARDDKQKATIRQALKGLRERGIIEPFGQKMGMYRKVVQTIEEMSLDASNINPFPVFLPFNLAGEPDSLTQVYPNEIITICGETNAGKTTLLFGTVLANLKNLILLKRILNTKGIKSIPEDSAGIGIRYLSSEMGSVAVSKKLMDYGPRQFQAWNEHISTVECNCDYEDYLFPGGINVIDYLEPPHGDFTQLAPSLTRIHSKLKGGIAIVAVQLPPGATLPRGGSGMWEKPRLIVNLFRRDNAAYRTLRIMKAKYFDEYDPHGKELDFIVHGDSRMSALSSNWSYPRKLENERKYISYTEQQSHIKAFPDRIKI